MSSKSKPGSGAGLYSPIRSPGACMRGGEWWLPHSDISALSDIQRLVRLHGGPEHAHFQLHSGGHSPTKSTGTRAPVDEEIKEEAGLSPQLPNQQEKAKEVEVEKVALAGAMADGRARPRPLSWAGGVTRLEHPMKQGLRLEFGDAVATEASGQTAEVDGGGTLWKMQGGTEVKYSMVNKPDGTVSAHISVDHKFAIGSKGMYDSDGGQYPPANAVVDDSGDNLLELDVLGRGGGSSMVVKALQMPSMKIVAVKKVPIDDPAKLRQAIHELQQLKTNQVRIRDARVEDTPRISPVLEGVPDGPDAPKLPGGEPCSSEGGGTKQSLFLSPLRLRTACLVARLWYRRRSLGLLPLHRLAL